MSEPISLEQPEAWVKLPSEDDIRAMSGGKVHPYEVFLGGRIALMARLLMAHPVIGPVFRPLSAAVLFGPGKLSRTEREMVAGVTAAAQGCVY
jgi:Carboxymuconolactone decarboxylase family